jgi:thioredoxin reductase
MMPTPMMPIPVMPTPMMNDVIVVGGSFAGLSAALQLARARRKVAVIDLGLRRNRFAAHSHGFLGQDGKAPGAIVAEARAQLMAYPTVTFVEGEAVSASGVSDAFTVEMTDGRSMGARRLILATGVADILPDVPGLSERWGDSVFMCPYCDGYELGGAPVGVLATGAHSFHQAMLLTEWGQTTFFLNGTFTPEPEQVAQFTARGGTIETAPVIAIEGERADIRLADGRVIPIAGLFTAGRMVMASPLAEQLGCEFEDGPLGSWIETDAMRATSVPGVFAAGDAVRLTGSVALSVADGALAGTATHRSLVFEPARAA